MAKSALITIMQNAARKAGRALVRDFGEVENLQVSRKGPADFVSAADKRAEDLIFRELSRARPGYGFYMEERGLIEGPDKTHRWIVDPLDGTTNFLHSIPLFAISIALEREGRIVAGVVYNPVMDELYSAERGAGAFMNDRRLRVSARRKLEDAVITTGIPALGRIGHRASLANVEALMPRAAGIRRFGSAALDLAFVASGRCDGYFEEGLNLYDIAAGVLLVREAGGFVSDYAGRDRALETGEVVAGNEHVQRQLVKLLKPSRAFATPADEAR